MVHSSRRDRRNQIVDGLEEVFLKEGFRKVRIEELASRLRCSRQTLYRLAPIQTDFLGTFVYPLDLTAPPEPAAQIMPGSTWYFQFWYRDPADGGANFNLSNALTVPFTP